MTMRFPGKSECWLKDKILRPTKKGTEDTQITLHGPVPHLVREFVAEIKTLSVHLFQANWQITQFAELTKKIPAGRAAITIDFAENYTCISQNEVQGAHWAKDSITIHPEIVYYRCRTDGGMVEKAEDIISNDLKHDSHAVHEFLRATFKHLTEKGDLLSIMPTF